jgi:hypothetical protein
VENVERGPGSSGNAIGGPQDASVVRRGGGKIQSRTVEDLNWSSGQRFRDDHVARGGRDRVMIGARYGLVMGVRDTPLGGRWQDAVVADKSQQHERQQ